MTHAFLYYRICHAFDSAGGSAEWLSIRFVYGYALLLGVNATWLFSMVIAKRWYRKENSQTQDKETAPTKSHQWKWLLNNLVFAVLALVFHHFAPRSSYLIVVVVFANSVVDLWLAADEYVPKQRPDVAADANT